MEKGHNGGGLANVLSNRPFIVGALFLGTYFVPFLVFIGVALAYYFSRHPEEDWEDTHFIYLVRTFWLVILTPLLLLLIIGIAAFTAHLLGAEIETENLTLVVIIVLALVMIPTLILAGVRIILSLMKSIANKPMPNPRSWLV